MTAYKMERKLLIAAMLFMLFMTAIATSGCSTTEVAEAEAQSHEVRFHTINESDDDVWVNTTVIVDMETGCQYIFAKQAELGGLELLVDQYGYPLLADGYERGSVTVLSQDYGE